MGVKFVTAVCLMSTFFSLRLNSSVSNKNKSNNNAIKNVFAVFINYLSFYQRLKKNNRQQFSEKL